MTTVAHVDCAALRGGPCEQVSVGTFLDRSGMMRSVEVRRCVNCGHATTFPPLADVRFLYGDRESQDYQPDIRNSLSKRIKSLAFRFQAKRLLRQVPPLGRTALDFGCGSGQFTTSISSLTPQTEWTASDFFDDRPQELAGCIYKSNDNLAEEGAQFDLVLALHVLEHDDDTPKLLAGICSFAKAGGTVVIEVPNVECWWNKVFGRFWDAWYLPYHRHHFSRRSLVRALERGGLEVLAVHGVTAPTMGRSMANLFGTRNNLFWLLFGIALHPIQLAGEAISGRRTALRAVARRPLAD
jgi:2-polyprenyl-3-methyl-5-hydroxy-6-metoxy-1,4-benzoquinol methylase